MAHVRLCPECDHVVRHEPSVASWANSTWTCDECWWRGVDPIVADVAELALRLENEALMADDFNDHAAAAEIRKVRERILKAAS